MRGVSEAMRIALISSSVHSVPPASYGGLERVVWDLAEALDELGHDVTIIAPEGSRCPEHGNIIETMPPNDRVEHDWVRAEMFAYERYKAFLGYFDIIHDHSWWACVYLAKREDPTLKVCHTHHGMFDWKTKPEYVTNLNLIACSEAQREHMMASIGEPCEVVHHGINMQEYPFYEEKTDRYFSLNRIAWFKGIDVFCQLMQRCNTRGDVVGEDAFVDDQDYVNAIKNICSSSKYLTYYGSVSQKDKVRLLQRAKAVVALPMLDRGFLEIFGLYVTEAMACGTPVIGLKNGGLIDQIVDGVTGFLCSDVGEVEEVIRSDAVSSIDLHECRARVVDHFSRKRMAENYLKLYNKILKNKEW